MHVQVRCTCSTTICTCTVAALGALRSLKDLSILRILSKSGRNRTRQRLIVRPVCVLKRSLRLDCRRAARRIVVRGRLLLLRLYTRYPLAVRAMGGLR